MTMQELMESGELLDVIAKEIDEKIGGGMTPEDAKTAALKAHGVEFDEDAAQAGKVAKMKLSDEELEHISGGVDNWCWSDHACYDVYKHDKKQNQFDACFWDYNCFWSVE